MSQNEDLSIGRLPFNNICFPWDKTISSKHAVMKLNENGDVIYIDDDSTNGTWVYMNYGFKLMLDDEQELRFGMQEVFKIQKY